MSIRYVILALVLVTGSVRNAACQSDPSGFGTVINLPSVTDGTLFNGTIQSDTQVNLFDGGALSGRAGDQNTTSSNIEVNVFGGLVHNNFNAWPVTRVNLLGGSIGGGFFLHDGSQLHITDGELGEAFRGQNGSYLELTEGHIERNAVTAGTALVAGGSSHLAAWQGGTVEYTGGTALRPVAFDGGTANVHGGFLGPNSGVGVTGTLNIHGGVIRDNFQLRHGHLNLFGSEFRLDGQLIPGLDETDDVVSIELGDEKTLSGILSDGMPFVLTPFNSERFGNVPVHLTASTIPVADPTVFRTSQDTVPFGIRDGQILIVDSGTSLTADLELGWGSSLVVEAGSNIELPLGQSIDGIRTHIDIAGGTSSPIRIHNGSRLMVRNGSSVPNVIADGESLVEIHGGNVRSVFGNDNTQILASAGEFDHVQLERSSGTITGGNSKRVYLSMSSLDWNGDAIDELQIVSSVANVFRGSIEDEITISSQGTLNIHGGDFNSSIQAASGSRINIFGTQFILDGIDITSTMRLGRPFTITQRDVLLTARLENGSLWEYDLSPRRDREHPDSFHPSALLRLVKVEAVPAPNSLSMLLILFLATQCGGSSFYNRRR